MLKFLQNHEDLVRKTCICRGQAHLKTREYGAAVCDAALVLQMRFHDAKAQALQSTGRFVGEKTGFSQIQPSLARPSFFETNCLRLFKVFQVGCKLHLLIFFASTAFNSLFVRVVALISLRQAWKLNLWPQWTVSEEIVGPKRWGRAQKNWGSVCRFDDSSTSLVLRWWSVLDSLPQ